MRRPAGLTPGWRASLCAVIPAQVGMTALKRQLLCEAYGTDKARRIEFLLHLHLRVFHRLRALGIERRRILLQALRDAAVADRNVGAMLVCVGLALGDHVLERQSQALELQRAIGHAVG